MRKRKLNNKRRKEDILRLRAEGKSYREIERELGCSKSVISYHCGSGSEKKRVYKWSKSIKGKLNKKITSFRSRISYSANNVAARTKLKTFKRRKKEGSRTHSKVNNITKNYTYQDVLNKLGKNPRCYLTGIPIDLEKTDTYHFDHIIPCSKGGTNDLSNLGVCTRSANYAKNDLSVEELYELCETILAWRDKSK
mgnify:CR=1 FL=1